jgi:DNA (cytosine-5)-methyltransferase 1
VSRLSLRFVDLFSGIGGFHIAIRDGFELSRCVFASDIDPDCQEVYTRAFRKRVFGDITTLTDPPEGTAREAIRRVIPAHDLLCAGFPCQPFSKSGQQRGIEETRGTLFFDILRVLEARRPKFVILENVMNLVGPRHRGTWSTILTQLRALGYAVSDDPTVLSPHLIPAPQGGAPQHRLRVYIPAIHVGRTAEALSVSLGPLISRSPFGLAGDWDVFDYLDAVDGTDRPQYAVRNEQTQAIDIWNALLPQINGEIPGVPIWGDVLLGRMRTDDANPKWKNAIIERNLEFADANRPVISNWLDQNPGFLDLKPSFRKLEWQARPGARDIWKHAIQFRPSGIRVKRLTYLPALVAINQTSIIGPLKRRILPHEAARLQGFPDDFPFGDDDAATYRQLGNAVAVGVTRLLAKTLIEGTDSSHGGYAPVEWQLARQASDAVPATWRARVSAIGEPTQPGAVTTTR